MARRFDKTDATSAHDRAWALLTEQRAANAPAAPVVISHFTSTTSGDAQTPNASLYRSFHFASASGNAAITINAPTGMVSGEIITLLFTASASGGPWGVTLNAALKVNTAFGGVTVSTTRVIQFIYDGTNWREIARSADVA